MQNLDRIAPLVDFVNNHPRLLVLTGAGISTDSGIPDYRDRHGQWKRKPPIQHQHFVNDPLVRQRHWGRSLIGWPLLKQTRPNRSHHVLAALEQQGRIQTLVTQNVDGLHEQAGQQRVIDLHGRADQVTCINCGWRCSRDEMHERCDELNPQYRQYQATAAPDGDADLEVNFSEFDVPACPQCGGILKPDVVFFGDNVPKERVFAALDALRKADALWVIGSSLMVYSGFRFCKRAQEWNIPIAALTLGQTRADHLLTVKTDAPIGPVLETLLAQLQTDLPETSVTVVGLHPPDFLQPSS